MNEINLIDQFNEYKNQLTEQEIIVLNIAIDHLGSSFDMSRSIGFIEWQKKNMNDNKKKGVHELMNGALNSTLSRTINTSLTTFVVLLIIFIFGGEVIRGFMFALMVGVVVGTYSSLFVASPIMLDTIKKKEEKSKRK